MGTQMIKAGTAVLKKLTEAGWEAYFVGGFVRDKHLGLPVQDIDIATSALPDQVMALFPKCIPTGLKHGTVTVRVSGFSFEVTTFRKESEYEAHRRPAQVEFVSDLDEDLRRRDFTMNAMAMDAAGNIFDPFGGRQDIVAGVLRSVGEAEERFSEDALRMMRCVRFASQYQLQVEPATWLALQGQIRLFKHVSMERVRAELSRIVGGLHPFEGLSLLADSRIFRHTKIKLSFPFADWTSKDLPVVLRRLESSSVVSLRWLLLAKEMELTPEAAETAWKALTFSLDDTKRVKQFLAFDQWLREALSSAKSEAEIRDSWVTGCLYYNETTLTDWLGVATLYQEMPEDPVHYPVFAGTDQETAESGVRLLLNHGSDWLREMPVKKLSQLSMNGEEVMRQLQRSSGPWLGKLMNRMLLETALGRLEPGKKALANRVADWAKDNPE
ncbi:CCA tRNA nucleotidyltransferase [Gorillibacterium massiliense]|uniref:CCA tRNA nucleotidyltransferase n=1 Tax=Gorillibacterium massiliense TaxID=1280390 RepID=UPI0004ACD0BD|nr:CCA tRNA nucleotidyltransferase [Gorillibacterium massiliense]